MIPFAATPPQDYQAYLDVLYNERLIRSKVDLSSQFWKRDHHVEIRAIEAAKRTHQMVADKKCTQLHAYFLARWLWLSYERTVLMQIDKLPPFLHIYLVDQYRQMVELFRERWPHYFTEPTTDAAHQNLRVSLRGIGVHTD